MRATLWLIGLFAAAVALALFAGGNPGTVTVFWPPHRIDLSVNLVLLLALLLFALLYGALRTVAALLELPRQARRWRVQQRERATNALLLDARVQFTAGRYLRARKAAESVLARTQAASAQRPDNPALIGLRTLANLTAAESAHALQDESNRNRFLDAALATATTPGAHAELREAVLLRAAQWAVSTQDPAGALARLAELPTGAQRRTAALRIKLKAARQAGHITDAMETARLLAKHRAFSAQAAASLMRGLAGEQIARAYDAPELQAIWAALSPTERAMPELALRAAQRLLDLNGSAALARNWLTPVWEQALAGPGTLTDAQQVRLAHALEQALAADGEDAGADTEWLARIESAQQAHPHDATLQYLAGMACLHRGLWGRAQLLLAQAARTLDDAGLRRNAWRAQARLAEERGDEDAAARAWRQAAQG